MSNITIFSGIFCREKPVVERVVAAKGYELITDQDLTAVASKVSGIAEDKIERAFSAKPSVFNKFTHEQERSVASLRLALAEKLMDGNLLISGFAGHLIPKAITHVLHVCLIGDLRFRVSVAAEELGLSEKEAIRKIHSHDTDRVRWVDMLFQKKDPWDPSLYDIVIPIGKKDVENASALILENVNQDILQPTTASKKAVQDFVLAAKVEVALAQEGHSVAVSAKDGLVTITINKHILMLHRLEEELKAITHNVKGVRDVQTKVSKDYYQTDIYRKYDFEVPSKVLLVDDEREFVETLSERLIMRQIGSAVAYDGESALELIEEDEPEVMILDLKMPGIDGIEVLRRVKATRPGIEVIILTGHGSEADKELCMKLGAFGYLTKPVDIDLLSETLKRANEKIRQTVAKKK